MSDVKAELLAYIKKHIPLSHALDIAFESFQDNELTTTAPLSKNINDKGSAFAGSIESVAVLSGWSLVTLSVNEKFASCQVAAVETRMSYKAALVGDILAQCKFDVAANIEQVFEKLEFKGRAVIPVQISLYEKENRGALKAEFKALYHIKVNA